MSHRPQKTKGNGFTVRVFSSEALLSLNKTSKIKIMIRGSQRSQPDWIGLDCWSKLRRSSRLEISKRQIKINAWYNLWNKNIHLSDNDNVNDNNNATCSINKIKIKFISSSHLTHSLALWWWWRLWLLTSTYQDLFIRSRGRGSSAVVWCRCRFDVDVDFPL